MTRRLVVDEAAEEELVAARDWYEEQVPGLGDAFVHAVDEAVARIGEMPGLRVPSVAGDLRIRRVMVPRFPYAVVYLEAENEYRVLAFAHHKRRPGFWRDRT